MDHYHGRIVQATNELRKLTNIVILLDTGLQTTIAGFGKVWDKFRETGLLQDFTGFGQNAATFEDEHFEDAALRTMTFC